MKKTLVKVIVFFSVVLGFSQQRELDSIKQLITTIDKQKPDTTQVRLLSHLGYDIIEIDSTLSKKLLEEALAKSVKLKNNYAISNSYRFLGLWYSNFNDKAKAFEFQNKALDAAKKDNHIYLMAGANFNLGSIKYETGEYDKCIDYFLEAQKIFDNPEILKDKKVTTRILDKRKSDLYFNMSIVFSTIKNLPKANEYIDKALAIGNKYNNQTVIAFYTQQKADNFTEAGNIEKALKIRLKHLPILEKSKIERSYLFGYYHNIAQEYLLLKKVDNSKIFAQKSFDIAKEINSSSGIAVSSLLVANIALQEKKYSEVEKFLNESEAYYLQTENPTEKRDYFKVLHQFLYETKKYKQAYEFFKQYADVNDEIITSEQAKQFSEREARYQSEKKDKNILILEKKQIQSKIFIYSLIGVSIGLLLFSYLLYRNYKARKKITEQKIKQLQQEKQIDAAQNLIQGEEAERTRLARDLHDGLGGMLSGVKFQLNSVKGNVILSEENANAFTKSISQLDSAIAEMRRVAHNMMPEALIKFGLDDTLKNYCNSVSENSGLEIIYQSFGLKERVNQTVEIVLYRIVQELLNNTIKHADATQIHVQLSKNNNTISLTVEDNGKGFDVNSQKKGGIGLGSIQHRVDYLQGKLDITSDNNGTSTHIEFETE
jgi:signal transduction histidine kinase